MLAAPAHPDLPTIFTTLLSRSIYLTSHAKTSHAKKSHAKNMADPSCRGSLIRKPGHQSRRRHQSRILKREPRRHDSLLSDREPPNDTRGRPSSRAASAEVFCWASADLPSSPPAYDPKPLLHREDAFKVVEEVVAETVLCTGLETDDSTEYDSDELEFCTTQLPEFGEACIYDFGA